ncbi:hypothetical protein [Flavobacterium sp.]|uniref:hypothetical protein n=1 Tax=Flavobacterium sp. TaxID=239 RepID=UPI0040476275
MKTLIYTPENPKTHFTVTKNDINNHNALLPSILYAEMQKFASTIVTNNIEIIENPAKLYQLEILKNAFLDDTLFMESQIKKFNSSELQLSLTVKKEHTNDLICKATFKFQFKNNIQKAS